MSYPLPRKGNNVPPFASDYQDYRPSSRHDLFYDNKPNLAVPSAPPHLESPGPVSPFEDPFAETEEPRRPYSDYKPGEPPIYSSRNDLSNPYLESQEQHPPYQPFRPLQSYEDNYAKPNDSFPNIEQGLNPPSPPPPPKRRTLFSRLFNGDQKRAYFCWIISIIQIGVFIGELVKNTIATKTPFEIHPVFNPLLGPSSYVPPASSL